MLNRVASSELICMRIRLLVLAARHSGMLGGLSLPTSIKDEVDQRSRPGALPSEGQQGSQGSFSINHRDGPSVNRENFLELAGLSSKLWHFATGWPPAKFTVP